MNLRGQVASLFAPLLLHGQNQSEAMQRAIAAKAQGLDPAAFGTPYPGSNVTTNNTTNQQTGKGWLIGPLIGLLLTAAGAGGAVWLTSLLGKVSVPPVPVPPQVRPEIPSPTPADPNWDAVYEQQQPDGSWKVIRREHLKKGP